MKIVKINNLWMCDILLTLILLFMSALCYPTGKPYESQPELKDEERFANGTVVGKYSYTDHEGNPVQVKYFADEGSYGVELKSVKVVDATTDPSVSTFEPMKLENMLKHTDTAMKFPSEIFGSNYPLMGHKYKPSDPYLFVNKDSGKNSYYKTQKTNPDYETYYQNELKGPEKCSKEKVRVYMNKDNRKIRNAINTLEADKFCEQF